MENISPSTGLPAKEPWGIRRKHHACELRVTMLDGSTHLVLRSGSSYTNAMRRIRARADVVSVDLVRKLTKEEFRWLKGLEPRTDGPDLPSPLSSIPKPPPSKHKACEVRVMVGGVAETRIYGASWTPTLRRRVLDSREGVESIELVRRMTREEYEAVRSRRSRRQEYRRLPKVASKPAADAPASIPTPEAAPPEPPAAARPTLPDVPGPARLPGPQRTRSAPFRAWEFLIRRDGEVKTHVVFCPTEAGALALILGLEGIEAASPIGSSSLEEYCGAATTRPAPST